LGGFKAALALAFVAFCVFCEADSSFVVISLTCAWDEGLDTVDYLGRGSLAGEGFEDRFSGEDEALKKAERGF